MKSITASCLARYVVANPFLSSLLILTVMIAGLVTGSLAVVIVSGVLAFGRPVFYCVLYSAKADAGKSTVIETDRRPSDSAMAFDLR